MFVVAWGFWYDANRPRPEPIDPASLQAATAACGSALASLSSLPQLPPASTPTLVERTTLVRREDAIFTDLVTRLDAVHPIDHDGAKALADFATDWQHLTQAREHYITALLAGGHDLLDARLESGDRLSDDDIVAESLGFLFAGHETTASALTWSMYELARHPTIADTTRAEGDDSDTLRRVLRETLRLHPPAWGIPRTATRTTTIGPYRVRRGVGVIVSTYTINRSPLYWDQPDTFDPDRFLPGHDPRRPAYLPLSFGAGPRMCIGQAFAELEAQLVLSHVLNQYDLDEPDASPPKFQPQFSLRMNNGLPVTLRQRATTHHN